MILHGEPTSDETAPRICWMWFGDVAKLVFRLLPLGFLNRNLRGLLAGLLGTQPSQISAGQVTYDLRRLRAHGLITRIPGTHRYRITDAGGHHTMLFTHIHTRLLQPGLTHLTDPDPPAPSTLRTAARNYQRVLDHPETRWWSRTSRGRR